MNTPRKAVVLAAGFGTRMAPLSTLTPKAMMPLWGKPLLEHTLSMLERWGVTDVLVNMHHAPDPVFNYLRKKRFNTLRLNMSFEPAILGTGGALRKADWFPDDSPFWIVNADVAADVSPRPFLDAWKRNEPLAALWMTDRHGPRTVYMSDGLVRNFRTSRPGIRGTYTFCGLHLVSPLILRFLPDQPFSSVVEAYERAIAEGHTVAGICVEKSFWADAGTPEDYIKAHALALDAYRENRAGALLVDPALIARAARSRKHGVRIDGFMSAGDNVTIRPGARIRNSVFWNNAVVGRNSVVESAIVAEGVTVRGHVARMALGADAAADTDLDTVLHGLKWRSGDVVVQPLAPRGSARSFTRLVAPGRSAIMIKYSLERPENGLYARNAGILKRVGVRVPAILMDMPEQMLTVVEDAGDVSLLDVAPGMSRPELTRTYLRVLDSVLLFHRRGARHLTAHKQTLLPSFSPRLYAWERSLFTTHCLTNHFAVSPAIVAAVSKELAAAGRRLSMEPLVLVHRDLQSSNILLPGGHPVFIDFQGMRLGPALYDLASLICDPYVSLSLDIQKELLDYYAARCGRPEQEVREVFWWAAIQRLIQALGAFGRLSSVKGTSHFSGYIAPGLAMLSRALEHVDNLPALRETVNVLGKHGGHV